MGAIELEQACYKRDLGVGCRCHLKGKQNAPWLYSQMCVVQIKGG